MQPNVAGTPVHHGGPQLVVAIAVAPMGVAVAKQTEFIGMPAHACGEKKYSTTIKRKKKEKTALNPFHAPPR
jgi:hypothetical protein